MIMLYLLEKEFKQFFRDPGLPKMAIAFPVLMMLVFPFAVSMEIRNIDLVVVDNNRTMASSKLIETCTASGYFDLVGVSDDPDWAMQQMDRNKADAILTIESDFDRSLERGEPLPVGIKVNTINGTKGSIGAGYLTSCVQRFYAEHAPGRQDSTTGAQLDVSPNYLSESHALLCRCHARHLHQGQHPGRRVDRCRRPAGHRCRHGIVGYPELQENNLNKKQ